MDERRFWLGLEDKALLWLVVAASVLFGWIAWTFSGAILWGMALALVFGPLYRRLRRWLGGRGTPAALLTMVLILLLVILPLLLIFASLFQQAAEVVARIRSGELDLAQGFRTITTALPGWLTPLLDRFGLTDLTLLEQRLQAALGQAGQLLAAQAFNFGQNTFDFVLNVFLMLYLLFFLLRDGEALSRRIKHAIPLHPEHRRVLSTKFTVVIRATIKGNIVLALIQGVLGGVAFWVLGLPAPILWGALMAVLSLLPAIGAALVWAPAALYLIATGLVWQGIVLIVVGVLVIGLVDNLLRPVLIGKDTRMPDYMVLLSTLGGIAIFGVNGFVLGPVIAAMFMASWDIFTAVRTATLPRAPDAGS